MASGWCRSPGLLRRLDHLDISGPVQGWAGHRGLVNSMDDDYAELVLSVVERIPPGQVATYGDIAEIVGRGGPRQVGHVMALWGGGVPWWRVVRADGRPARSLEVSGLRLLMPTRLRSRVTALTWRGPVSESTRQQLRSGDPL